MSGSIGASPSGMSGSIGASPSGCRVLLGCHLRGHCILLGHCHRQCRVYITGITGATDRVGFEIGLSTISGKPHSGFTWLTAAQFKGGNRSIWRIGE
jgi:hypothetical protein